MYMYTGGGLGWMIGAVNDLLSWRWIFHILGIAGLCLVPLATLAMWEPGHVRRSRKSRQQGKSSYSIKVGLGFFQPLANTTFFQTPTP